MRRLESMIRLGGLLTAAGVCGCQPAAPSGETAPPSMVAETDSPKSPSSNREPAAAPDTTDNNNPPSTDKPAAPPPSSPEEDALQDLTSEELVKRLSDAQQRDTASRALAAKDAAAVEPLVAALEHDDWQVRAAAAFTLGQLGAAARPAVPALQERAKADDTPAVRDAAAFAIDAIEQEQD